VVLINPTDYSLYLPLLPEVAAGILNPRRVSVPLAATLPGVRLVLGAVEVVDLDARLIVLLDPEGQRHTVGYDQLLLAVGSVNRLLPILGVAEHAHGFRSVAEAVYLRDHLVRQLELAATSDDPAERAARCTFVVVGAGYTGTEVAAHGQLLTRAAARQRPSLAGQRVRWLLLDLAPRVLPELDRRLSATAGRVLRKREVEVRLQTTVQAATAEGVRLSDGSSLPHARWSGVGVRPDPLTASLGLPTKGGRLVVDEHLTVPSHPEVLAGGDAAAVPDHTRPGQLTPMTAQHARRQGRRAAANLAASLGHGHRRAYRHRDLGFVVDLGGAKAVTRGYHLTAIPTNRVRIAPTGYWTPCCLSRRSISAWSAAPRSRWEAPPEPPAAQREAKPGPDEALAPADPRRTR
jgi:NADH dehydrogenase